VPEHNVCFRTGQLACAMHHIVMTNAAGTYGDEHIPGSGLGRFNILNT